MKERFYDKTHNLSEINVNGEIIKIEWDLLLDDTFTKTVYFSKYKSGEWYNKEYEFTTKELIYFRINDYFKNNPKVNDIISSTLTGTAINKELQEISRLKKHLLTYMENQKTKFNDMRIVKQPFEMEDYLLDTKKDIDLGIYNLVLQDIIDTEKKLIESSEIELHKKATMQYKLFDDLRGYLKENYEYQVEKIKKKMLDTALRIKNFDNKKEGLSQLKHNQRNNKAKYKQIPKDTNLKMEHFLNGFDINVNSNNLPKYDTEYIFSYIVVE